MVHCCRTLGMPNSQQGTLDLTSTSYRDNCDRLLYLEEKQRELCALSQNILTVSHSSTSSLTHFPTQSLATFFASSHVYLLPYSLTHSLPLMLSRHLTRFLAILLTILLGSTHFYFATLLTSSQAC